MRLLTLTLCLFTAAFLNAQTESLPNISLELFSSGWSSPVGLYNCGDDRMFILEQSAGDIEIIDANGAGVGKFLDLTGIISTGSERGLLGLAFHPDYLNNGTFFVNYTNDDGDTEITKYQVDPNNANQADASSAEVIMTISQPYGNHNGGHIAFGPDGYLYIGMGDGGAGNDPENYAQNTQSLLGKMLRIDVDVATGYQVPANNPFVGDASTLDEIWSIGLRNPWKFSFDRTQGDMWIGDVGQSAWEEIDFQPVGSAGGENYGWRCYEGSNPHIQGGCGPDSDYTDPVAEVSHSSPFNWCSVTGGYVYRGQDYPNLQGYYFFTDYCVGDFYVVDKVDDNNFQMNEVLPNQGFGWSAFGENSAGELFAVLIGGGIYRIVDDCADATPTISQVGFGAMGELGVDIAGDAYWYLDGNLISNDPSATYTPQVSGTYYAVVDNGAGCSIASNSISWGVVSGITGCTYAESIEYNPLATIDDGSCIFGIPDDCIADLNNDFIVNAGDLLLFLAEFGTFCE